MFQIYLKVLLVFTPLPHPILVCSTVVISIYIAYNESNVVKLDMTGALAHCVLIHHCGVQQLPAGLK